MRKATACIFALCVGFAAIGLTSLSARAATLLVSGGQLTGAKGVNVSDTLYDVRFADGTCIALFSGCDGPSDFAFNDATTALAAAQALLDQVFLDDILGDFDTTPALTFGCSNPSSCTAAIPYARLNPTDVLIAIADNRTPSFPDKAGTGLAIAPATDTAPVGATTYAIFSAEVPAPSTLLLFGVGLAGLTAFERRRRQG